MMIVPYHMTEPMSIVWSQCVAVDVAPSTTVSKLQSAPQEFSPPEQEWHSKKGFCLGSAAEAAISASRNLQYFESLQIKHGRNQKPLIHQKEDLAEINLKLSPLYNPTGSESHPPGCSIPSRIPPQTKRVRIPRSNVRSDKKSTPFEASQIRGEFRSRAVKRLAAREARSNTQGSLSKHELQGSADKKAQARQPGSPRSKSGHKLEQLKSPSNCPRVVGCRGLAIGKQDADASGVEEMQQPPPRQRPELRGNASRENSFAQRPRPASPSGSFRSPKRNPPASPRLAPDKTAGQQPPTPSRTSHFYL